ncbi:alpha/beta hydrolase [Flavisphingomonas formosensis]|uniref:alpha/beta hydrolase n=1 Tax=Flavisphingomonas formosensis TaxID=861534 RepID=UPI0012F9A4BA|nr:alpha/beta hydrolase [Sphingomonas formosensis]
MAAVDWKLPAERLGSDAPDALKARRAAVASRPAEPLTTGTSLSETMLGGIRCLVVTPDRPTLRILYFHGGGYRLGAPEGWTGFASRLAVACGAEMIVADYRLAPEHPFPAALHDAAAVRGALDGTFPLVIAGDSAGGGLAAALCVAAHAAGQEQAAGLVLLSPMLDLLATDPTYAQRAESDRFFSRETMLECAALYLQGHPPEDPLASPGRADPAAFPPTLLLAGGAEVMLGESLALTDRLARAGRSVSLHVAADMQHVWPMLFSDLPETPAAVAIIAAFLGSLR